MKHIFENFIIKRLKSDLVNLNYLNSINDKKYSSNLVDQKKYSFDQLKKYADNNITDFRAPSSGLILIVDPSYL